MTGHSIESNSWLGSVFLQRANGLINHHRRMVYDFQVLRFEFNCSHIAGCGDRDGNNEVAKDVVSFRW